MRSRVVVSCHAERLLDDGVWSRLVAFRPGLRIAMLIRPPEPGENEELWLERAREVAAHGPFGLHTHFVDARHARPPGAAPEHGARVRAQVEWMREQGLEPRFFCGGGWFIDEGVARVVAELGLTDCTATAFRPSYLLAGAPRLQLERPARVRLDERTDFLELPSTHSIGAAARATVQRLRLPVLHVYFHDTDLLDARRTLALRTALSILRRRCAPTDLDVLAAQGATEVAVATLARP
ncbi:MAG TPA: hypothetical protein VFM96_00775 [Gaiellaceae bacterium]|nr:hypothetical protein [Gaiellaceae bacterium]